MSFARLSTAFFPSPLSLSARGRKNLLPLLLLLMPMDHGTRPYANRQHVLLHQTLLLLVPFQSFQPSSLSLFSMNINWTGDFTPSLLPLPPPFSPLSSMRKAAGHVCMWEWESGECVCVGVAFVVSRLLSGRERGKESPIKRKQSSGDEMDTLAVN